MIKQRATRETSCGRPHQIRPADAPAFTPERRTCFLLSGVKAGGFSPCRRSDHQCVFVAIRSLQQAAIPGVDAINRCDAQRSGYSHCFAPSVATMGFERLVACVLRHLGANEVAALEALYPLVSYQVPTRETG